ncbi:MAG: DUF748 domain-containing protein [Flavobacteriales bacterium]
METPKETIPKKKRRFIILKITVLIAVVVLVMISPIVKYLIEKYDVKYTGREITLESATVNPFTGYVKLSDVIIYESQSDSIFLTSESISVDFALRKLFSGEYEIHDLKLDHPRGNIIQNQLEFNLDDIIQLFSADSIADSTRTPTHFSIIGLSVVAGEFHYIEEITPIHYYIKEVNLESPGILWDNDTIAFEYDFLSGIGEGSMSGNLAINSNNLDYHIDVKAVKYDLQFVQQYLTEFTNYGTFKAYIDADLKTTGNFNDSENITALGYLALKDFHFGKNEGEDYASFEELEFMIDELSPKKQVYMFDTVALLKPYFKYEMYDYLDNLQTMFGEGGSNLEGASSEPSKFNLVVEIANYVQVLAKNSLRSNYQINRFSITEGNLKFNDYSYSEKFSIALSPFSVLADSINKNDRRVNLILKTGIEPFGNSRVDLSINPKDSSDFDIEYHFNGLPISMFNPYIISQTSFPVDRGTLEIHGTWNVRNGKINSKNHVVVIDPRTAKKIKNKDSKWLPVPLIMGFVRERGNVIDYEIPITGNLKDPKFHLRDVLIDLLLNIFIKPPTTGYALKIKKIESEIEKSFSIRWDLHSATITRKQDKFIQNISNFLRDNPNASITITPQIYTIKEKEYLLLYEAKKKFFISLHNRTTNSFSDSDSILVSKMSAKDSAFVKYLNKNAHDALVFTIQGKCAQLISAEFLDSKLTQLNKERKKQFLQLFKDDGTDNRVHFAESLSLVPYNGFSAYKIDYSGDFPEKITRAFEDLNELDDKEPRKKFRKERKKIPNGIK